MDRYKPLWKDRKRKRAGWLALSVEEQCECMEVSCVLQSAFGSR